MDLPFQNHLAFTGESRPGRSVTQMPFEPGGLAISNRIALMPAGAAQGLRARGAPDAPLRPDR